MTSPFERPQENNNLQTYKQGLMFTNQKTLRELNNRLQNSDFDLIQSEPINESLNRNVTKQDQSSLQILLKNIQEESIQSLALGQVISVGETHSIKNQPSKFSNSEVNDSKGQLKELVSENQYIQRSNILIDRNYNRLQVNTRQQVNKKKPYSLVGVLRWGLNVLRFKRLFMLPVERKRDRNKITPSHFNMIGDKTYQYGKFTHKSADLSSSQEIIKQDICILKLITCVSNFLQCLPIVLPNQKYKILWDCFYQFLILYRMFVVTIKLSFYLTDLSAVSNFINSYQAYAINIAFIVDVLLNLQTGFYDRGQIVLERPRIMRKYFDQFFVRDLLSQTPMLLGYFVTSDSSYSLIVFQFILEWLIFLQYRSLQRVYARVERALMENPTVAMYLPIVNLYLQIVIMCHVLALIYHLIAVYEIEVLGSEQTWLNIQGVVGEVWYIKYLRAYYWAGCTVINIILYLPESNLEIMFAILTIFFTFWVFGNTINTVDEFRRQTGHREREINAERHLINAFISKRGIDSNLKERIQMYVEYKYEEGLEHSQQEEEAVLRKLSPQLQREVLQAIYAEAVQRFPFVRHYSAHTQGEAMMKIREELYQPGAVIYDEGDVGESCVYIIKKGVVELSVINKKLKYLQENDQFGMVEFMIGGQRNCTARAKDACTLIKMRRDDFQAIIHENQDDYERFCELRDDLMHRTTNVYLSVCCYVCGADSHSHAECPEVHYLPQMLKLIYDYNHLHNQKHCQIRSAHQRETERTVNALMGREEVLQAVEEIQNADDSQIEQAIQIIEEEVQKDITGSMILEALEECENKYETSSSIFSCKQENQNKMLKKNIRTNQFDMIKEDQEKNNDSLYLKNGEDYSGEESNSESSILCKNQEKQFQMTLDQIEKPQEIPNSLIKSLESLEIKMQDGSDINRGERNLGIRQNFNKNNFNDRVISVNTSVDYNNTKFEQNSIKTLLDIHKQFENPDNNVKATSETSKLINQDPKNLLQLLKTQVNQIKIEGKNTQKNLRRRGSRNLIIDKFSYQPSSDDKNHINNNNQFKQNLQKLIEKQQNKGLFSASPFAQIPDKNQILQKLNQIQCSNTSKQSIVINQRRQSQLMFDTAGALGKLVKAEPERAINLKPIISEKRVQKILLDRVSSSALSNQQKISLSNINIDQLSRLRLSMLNNQNLKVNFQAQQSTEHHSSIQPMTDSAIETLPTDYNKNNQKLSSQMPNQFTPYQRGTIALSKSKSISIQGSEHFFDSISQQERLIQEYIQDNFDRCKMFRYYKPLSNYAIVVKQVANSYELATKQQQIDIQLQNIEHYQQK